MKFLFLISLLFIHPSCKKASNNAKEEKSVKAPSIEQNAAQDTSQEEGNALDTTVSCSISESGGQPFCLEYTGVPKEIFLQMGAQCANRNGAFASKTKCERTNNAGGCTQASPNAPAGTDSVQLVIYYYKPHLKTDLVKEMCKQQGESFVSP